MDKLFKVFNILIIVAAVISLLIMVVTMLSISSATSGADGYIHEGATFFTFLALLPSAILTVIAILAGKAGLQSDPYSCRKWAKVLLIVAVLDALTSLTSGFSASMVIKVAIYGFYFYLANTVSY